MEKVTISADVDFAAALLAYGLAHRRGVTVGEVLTYLVRRYVADVAAGVVRLGELPQAQPERKARRSARHSPHDAAPKGWGSQPFRSDTRA